MITLGVPLTPPVQLRQGLPQLVQVGSDSSGQLEAKLAGEVAEVRSSLLAEERERMEGLEAASLEVAGVRESLGGLEERLLRLELRPEAPPVLPVQEEELATALVTVPEISAFAPAMAQEEQGQVAALRERLEAVTSLLTAPLSVAFDAVRCEDFLGQDGWLPFDKLNCNLGGGMNSESGMFTVPVSGLYMFLVNVYGAPREGVVLSIK